jgi:hypothetical protein
MNSLLETEFPLREAQHLRYDLLHTLTDRDLAYKLPGSNPTLGELCRANGELEYCYIQSFKTFKHDWSHPPSEPELATRVVALEAWFTRLDQEFEDVVRGFSDEDLHHKQIDHGHGFRPSLFVQWQIYHEALLMFYAKADVYLKALQKTVNDQWRIGVSEDKPAAL